MNEIQFLSQPHLNDSFIVWRNAGKISIGQIQDLLHKRGFHAISCLYINYYFRVQVLYEHIGVEPIEIRRGICFSSN